MKRARPKKSFEVTPQQIRSEVDSILSQGEVAEVTRVREIFRVEVSRELEGEDTKTISLFLDPLSLKSDPRPVGEVVDQMLHRNDWK